MQTICEVEVDVEQDKALGRQRFGLLVGHVYRQWRRQVDLSFKDVGLSDATRMPLLVLYIHTEPMRQKDLAQALCLESSSLVRVLAHLRSVHLVDWSCDSMDRRIKRIALTDDGRRVAAQILHKSLEIEQALLADLSKQELMVTRATLQKIAQRFDVLGSACCTE